MQTVRVSVVIPAYNEEKLLKRCLVSLQNQTCQPFEIIIVDNNSTDATAKIAKEQGVIVIQERRQGIAWARDAGFKRATGDIIARLDADCIAPPNWIQKISDHYQGNSFETKSAITGRGYYTTRSKLLGKLLGTIMTTGFNLGNRIMLGNVALYGSCMAFPRSWWSEVENVVCRDSRAIHEDIDLSVHLLERGHRIVALSGFYSYIDSRTLRESPRKTWWRWRIWPHSIYRHRREKT